MATASARPNIEKLAARGTSLLITVDCGVTAVDEVRLARELGIETIVTDHHQAGDELPGCPILHPALDGYPFEHLCGTAVAWKLASALREASGVGFPGALSRGVPGSPTPDASHGADDADLDLVALATVADVVPLVGENRALVKRGLGEMRRARRVGLRALMEASKCEPSRLDEGDLAFRLAPRINAAGRLYRADAGVELLLTEDQARAEEIAVELGRANSERRSREREVDAAAEAARRQLSDELREAPGLVLAGEGWHPGVVGIVASRLVERHHRPVVVISLDGEGGGRGSGRSIPGFDLHAALEACAEHLESFGGHRAAAGLSLRAEQVEAFRGAFAAHAARVLSPEDLCRTERVDAMVGGVGLGLELAEELGRLAPFGMGNPGVRLMVPSARVSDVRTMGEGKHARFSLHSGAHRALGVAFGRSSLGVGDEDQVDATVRLEVNHWNGSVEPRVVLRELYPLEDEADASSGKGREPSLHSCSCDDEEWWGRFEAELRRDLRHRTAAARVDFRPDLRSRWRVRRRNDRRAGLQRRRRTGRLRRRLPTGGTGDRCYRSRPLQRRRRPHRLLRLRQRCPRHGDRPRPGWPGTGRLRDARARRRGRGRFRARRPGRSTAVGRRRGTGGYGAAATSTPSGPIWSVSSRSPCTTSGAPRARLWPASSAGLREAGEASGPALRDALRGEGSRPLAPESAARCFRVLVELELAAGEPAGGAGTVGVVSSEGTDLERSAAFRAYRRDHSEASQYLARPPHP